KQDGPAEQALRRAVELEPKSPGRLIDLAKFLAQHGRQSESDALFAQAAKLGPDSPEWLFARAEVYIQQKRNLDDARRLVQRYMTSSLTPDNPSREEARKLLNKIEQ